MPNPVCVTRPCSTLDDTRRSWHHLLWCPGCDELHAPRSVMVGETPIDGPHWDWNGDDVAPTFSPSYLTRGVRKIGPSDPSPTASRQEHVCHSFIRDGRWQFLPDCTHALAGQTVDMVPVPDWVVR